MDECKAMKIKTLGPDINESYNKFSVNKDGAIRFGLAAIKGMGATAAESIIMEREKNGPYKDIFDVAQRVNLSSCNRKCFESMALSGGFDSFGIKRERYFAQNDKGENFFDTIIRYGQKYQSSKNEMQNSLFGGMEEVEIATPKIPESESWSDIERLNRERDLVGIYLSAHPLDQYTVILDNMCNTKCPELENKDKLKDRTEITIGGIVTKIREAFTKRGTPCGFVTLEDFTGAGELALFGDPWGKWKGMFTEGVSVFITAKMTQRDYGNMYDLTISDVKFLSDIKDSAVEKITIHINSQLVTEDMATELKSIFDMHTGKSQVFVQLNNLPQQRNIIMRCKNTSIDVTPDLLRYIKECEAMEYSIN